jgi:hypothetical protein
LLPHVTSLLLCFITSSLQEPLKWNPPSSLVPETPSTQPDSANSPSPTAVNAACSVISLTQPFAWFTLAKSSRSSEEEIGEELKSISGQFRTTTDINHVIGKLFKLVAAGRIPARRAENLTYLTQLLLYSQKHIRYESLLADPDMNEWEDTVRAAYPAPESDDDPETEPKEETAKTH